MLLKLICRGSEVTLIRLEGKRVDSWQYYICPPFVKKRIGGGENFFYIPVVFSGRVNIGAAVSGRKLLSPLRKSNTQTFQFGVVAMLCASGFTFGPRIEGPPDALWAPV